MFFSVLQDLESYMREPNKYCEQVHTWFDGTEAEEKRTQTRLYLNTLMHEKYM